MFCRTNQEAGRKCHKEVAPMRRLGGWVGWAGGPLVGSAVVLAVLLVVLGHGAGVVQAQPAYLPRVG